MSFYNKFKMSILLFSTFFLPITYNLYLLKLYTSFVCTMCYIEFYKQIINSDVYTHINIYNHLLIFYWLIFPLFIVNNLVPLQNCWDIITITIFSDLIQQISNKVFVYFNIYNKYVNKIMLYNPFPFLSPNKTIVGYLGGLFTLLVSYIYNYNMFLIFSFYLSGCIGDLFASYFKRLQKIDNYSNLLGSHGGFLDRFDAVIFNLHLLFLYSFFIDF